MTDHYKAWPVKVYGGIDQGEWSTVFTQFPTCSSSFIPKVEYIRKDLVEAHQVAIVTATLEAVLKIRLDAEFAKQMIEELDPIEILKGIDSGTLRLQVV